MYYYVTKVFLTNKRTNTFSFFPYVFTLDRILYTISFLHEALIQGNPSPRSTFFITQVYISVTSGKIYSMKYEFHYSWEKKQCCSSNEKGKSWSTTRSKLSEKLLRHRADHEIKEKSTDYYTLDKLGKWESRYKSGQIIFIYHFRWNTYE